MDIAKACKQLIITRPFYGLFLLSLNKHYSDLIDTLAVTKNGINCELLINLKFWESLSDLEQLAVLQHEIMHICFKHILMAEEFDDHNLFNIAADMEVNSYIENLPIGAYLPKDFGLPDCKGTKFYYDFIKANPDKFPQNSSGNQSKNIDQNGKGNLKDQNQGISGPQNHKLWDNFKNISDAEKQLINNQIDHVAKHTAEQIQKIQGRIPGELSEYIGDLFKPKPSIFNWRSYFRRCIGTIRDITLRKTRKKESIRFPDASGIKYRKKSKILVAIDTSGSVSSQELCDFFSEINHIYKAGAEIEIMECDMYITAHYKYDGTFKGEVHGRGGTSFHPPIEYYNEHRKEYTTMVYFTDGGADLNFKVLKDMIWIITSSGLRQDYPGKIIYIPKNY